MSKEPLDADLIRGHIDTIILKSLYDGDRYGYDIIKEIDRKTGGKYKIKQPTLYSCLKRLEEQGFTRSYWDEKDVGSRKKYYTLTDMGKEVFLQNQSNWQHSKEILDLLISEASENIVTSSEAQKENINEQDEQQYDNFERLYEDKKTQERYDNFYIKQDDNEINKIFIPPQDERLYEQSSFNRYRFTESTYELEQDTNILKEVILESEKPTNKIENDENINAVIESFYQKQKIKQSYLDTLSNVNYQPKSKNESFFNWNYAQESSYSNVFNDTDNDYSEDSKEEYTADVNELPYEEQPKIENDAVLLTKSDVIHNLEENKSFLQFFKYDSSSLTKLNDAEIINREYHHALSKLIRTQKPKYSANPYLQKKLEKTAESAKAMGEDIQIRRHNDILKEYNSQNYYYSNRLMLVHYAMMFIIMLIETAAAFVAFEVIIHKGIITALDLGIYITGVALALLLPIGAFLQASRNFNKRKKADFDFKSSFIYRLILTILFVIIITSINAYLGIVTNDFTDYLASFVYPIIMTSNLLISTLIFYLIYKSNKFKCK